MKDDLWVEKYRPKCIDDCILPPKMKRTLKGFIKNKEVPNLMFTGIQGTGKTTCAKALVNELGAESLFIDCSTDNGKSMIENTVYPFSTTVSVYNPDVHKFIICDEADGLTQAAQRSLRSPIEKTSSNARFIFTGNFPEKFIDALKSRCCQFDMTITPENKIKMQYQFYNRCVKILDENNISYDKDVLIKFIGKLFPDFRKIINELQAYSYGDNIIDEGILTISSNEIAESLYPILLNKDFNGCKKWVNETISTPDDIFSSMYKKMNDYIKPEFQPQVIMILADYQDKSSRVANQTINLVACCVEIMHSLR